jgi:chromosomal replication initiator protein
MNKLPNQYGKTVCLYKDNIQDQAFKTWFEPIKSVELTDNALYIQVPSKNEVRNLCKITLK